jgi:hypothetical protein
MTYLVKRRVTAAKVETTIGTAIALANADGNENFYNTKIVPNVTVEERPGQGGFGRLGGVPGARTGTATFRTYIYYDGTTVPFWAEVTSFLLVAG